MNKKANIFLGIFIAMFIYVSGIMILPFILDDITTARTSLECSDTTISDGTKITCLAFSGLTPYFIWFLMSVTLGFVLGGRG